MKKILHLATDEKFINSAYWQFEKVYPKQNKFLVVLPSLDYKVKHVESNDNVVFVNYHKDTIARIVQEIENYDLVVLHGLDYFKSRIVLNSNRNVKFLWIFWGAEIFNNDKASLLNIYGKETELRFIKSKRKNILKDILRPIYYRIKYRSFTPNVNILKAAIKINYFGCLFEEDYELLKKNNIVNSEFIKFTYYPIEFIFKGIDNLRVNNNNILLGNSSSESNNHLEAFNILKKINLDNKKIVTPLSYGKIEYAKKIIDEGKQVFRNNFEPLTEFMPLEEYNKLLQQCGIVIMNHYRQQAVGNILAMIWMGARVYLREKNTFFNYLKRIDVEVFSIERDLKPENEIVFSLLDENDVENNRRVLKKEIGKNVLLKKLKCQLEPILNQNDH